LGISVSGNGGLLGKPMAAASRNRLLRVGSAALLILLFVSVLSPAEPVPADEQGKTDGTQRGASENPVLNGTFSPTGEAPKAGLQNDTGLRQDGLDSLPSCCSWESVAAFLAASGGDAPHTMAETLYVLSTQNALRVAGDALSVEKTYLHQPTSAQKRKGLMETKKSLQGAYADLRVEMEAMAKDNVPGKGELLANIKNALDAIQRGLSIHQRILTGKTAAPALLSDIRRLDRLLARISADCRAYLAGG